MKVLMHSARGAICRSKGFMMIHDLGCLYVRYGISNDLNLLLLSSFYNFSIYLSRMALPQAAYPRYLQQRR